MNGSKKYAPRGDAFLKAETAKIHRVEEENAPQHVEVEEERRSRPWKPPQENYPSVKSQASEKTRLMEDGDFIELHLWPAGLRITHWLNLFAVMMLSVTGYCIMDPFLFSTNTGSTDTGFLFGTIRFIHICCGFLWCAIGIVRLYLLFVSKAKQTRWRGLWPWWKKEDVINTGRMAMYYAFLRKDAPFYVGHNPLQQLAYTGIYILCIMEVISGLSLYSLALVNDNWFWAMLAMPAQWLGIPTMRLLHASFMFCMWVFVIIHVYLVFRAEVVERHGALSSMVGGTSWVRASVRPVDLDDIS
ncbi:MULTISPECIES: Ni/Fe-hydrogenase, b-type cytochrome subunit [Corynebacterium]|uniref:Ni/Fe-hydrogenase, b-type cytochrome subunit n=2 Tax=Corynebacterium glucuronolyticum TaxID=39791 RepID=A0A7T4EH55_9CORY|nr:MULTISPECIES: Ni/Fe-hydrogenase, b-type cytochrome subunit [Corynebacterium]EEI25975.1 Ni/Fe-hydrogenase, b-type cytochrome subunit [Corynebacterium glucuronolyticum ATCC 51867]EEI64311.1 Ni/Fe-hydrogenase, b-type cytochrome subunit [Corynebacterium glucuronolyticum ATCC 51866]MCT1442336.1 Ni/Fe-hydrogenase, b-type cytochrome subunit [Corynebacterium glucuronolyticum]MCT1563769.1 Ni/Fe-hydrogenase, b-type cytochrome subunit [Corynebacterium glucuronolyticum]OFO45979.1 Ni/Fe-hydrogenase, b-t